MTILSTYLQFFCPLKVQMRKPQQNLLYLIEPLIICVGCSWGLGQVFGDNLQLQSQSLPQKLLYTSLKRHFHRQHLTLSAMDLSLTIDSDSTIKLDLSWKGVWRSKMKPREIQKWQLFAALTQCCSGGSATNSWCTSSIQCADYHFCEGFFGASVLRVSVFDAVFTTLKFELESDLWVVIEQSWWFHDLAPIF